MGGGRGGGEEKEEKGLSPKSNGYFPVSIPN